MRKFLMVPFLIVLGGGAEAQNFSCSFGKQGACLDYGDKVCSSYSKCVDQNAACFDTYQCDYEGFTCKSNVTECVQGHDDLVRKYNFLSSDYDDLVNKYNTLLSDYNNLLATAKKQARELDGIKSCLVYADDLDEAKACEWY